MPTASPVVKPTPVVHVDLSRPPDVDLEPFDLDDFGRVKRREDFRWRAEAFRSDRERLREAVAIAHADELQLVNLDVPQLVVLDEHARHLRLDDQAEPFRLLLECGRAAGADLQRVRQAEIRHRGERRLECRGTAVVGRPDTVELGYRNRRTHRPEISLAVLESRSLQYAAEPFPRHRKGGMQALAVGAHADVTRKTRHFPGTMV